MKSKILFSNIINGESVVKLFDALGVELKGNVAAKIHSGEEGNQNYLKPDFWKPIIERLNATVVECNTAYDGERNTTEKHLKLLKNHGWSTNFKVDLLDETGPDGVIEIPNGVRIKKDYVGKNLFKYDSVIVLSHFKGHPMGGYGGALKQLSIGFGSSYGKAYIHGAGDTSKIWTQEQDAFLEAMADAAWGVNNLFKNKIIYVNVMKNMSVDCDCCAIAEDPCLKDIGILISTDPVAIDQACLDLVRTSKDKGKEHFLDRVDSRHGVHTIEAAAALGVGSREYELISID